MQYIHSIFSIPLFKCQQTLKLNSNNQFKLVLELACKSVEVSSLKRGKYTDAKKKECSNCSMSQTKIKMIMKNPICPQVGLKLRLFCEEANTTMSVYNNLTLFICNCKCIMNLSFDLKGKVFPQSSLVSRREFYHVFNNFIATGNWKLSKTN